VTIFRVEAEAAGDAEPAAGTAAVARAERAGSVLEQRQLVRQLVQPQRPSEEVHAEQQPRPRAGFDPRRVEVHRLRVDVDEHRP